MADTAQSDDKTVRILFLDDEQLILSALKRTLRREGFELHFTSDPFEVPKLIGEKKIDIIVSDHMMPQMTGVEVLGLVRRLHSHTIRIMMTGQADKDATIRAINEGSIHRFIEKPWDDQALKNALHEAARMCLVQRAARDELAAVRTSRTSGGPTTTRGFPSPPHTPVKAAPHAPQPQQAQQAPSASHGIERDASGAIVLSLE